MDMQTITLIFFIVWIVGLFAWVILVMSDIIENVFDALKINHIDEGNPILMFLWPYPLCVIIYCLIKKIKVTTNFNQKQMNLKILTKAMGYMFMPTLGVLLMLLVAFCDPIKMWNFFISDNGWAVFIRTLLFIAEVGLVIVMYFHFLRRDALEKAQNGVKDSVARNIDDNCYLRTMFPDDKNYRKYQWFKTDCPDIVVVERKPNN